MTRSNWKPLYKNSDLDSSISSLKNKNMVIKTFIRNLEITRDLVDYTFMVYNGNTFRKITIQSKMIGHKLGEFAPTRKKPSTKKKKKKKR
jgi:small subunit ribosomal protein S19